MVYVPNGDFGAEFVASEEALTMVGEIAAAARPIAEAGAPRRSGHLAGSVKAESGFLNGIATGRVVATDFKAAWKEFGTRRESADPFLRPAMESVTGSPVVGSAK